MKNQGLKVVFGLIVFLFSGALAYFTATYLSDNHMFDYWGALAIFAGAYVLVGILVSMVFSISLGFLFAADVLILNLLHQYYGEWANELKLTLIGVILLILYVSSAMRFKDEPALISAPQAPSNTGIS